MFNKLIDNVKYNLELKKINNEYNSKTLKETKEYRLKILDLNLMFKKIDQYTFDISKTKILGEDKDKVDLDIDLLTIDHYYKKIDWIEYCKRKNDLLGKPWMAIRSDDSENANPDSIQIELVHNNEFINYCKKLGIPGDSDDEISENYLKWFFISNIEDDDLSLIAKEEDETSEDNKDYVSNTKVNNNIFVK